MASDYTLSVDARIGKVAASLAGAANCLAAGCVGLADEHLDSARDWIDARSSFGGHYLPAAVRFRAETLVCALAELATK